jgi:hypothetical protein
METCCFVGIGNGLIAGSRSLDGGQKDEQDDHSPSMTPLRGSGLTNND